MRSDESSVHESANTPAVWSKHINATDRGNISRALNKPFSAELFHVIYTEEITEFKKTGAFP